MASGRVIWPPHPYRAGFCITDDTDAATLENVSIVYDFLSSIGLVASKTVWVFEPEEPCGIPPLPASIQRGITLEDPRYLEYCRKLSARGFEICLHGASSGNNRRERMARALRFVAEQFGPAGTYICHAKNAENIYWHEGVAPQGAVRWALSRLSRYRCSGEDPASPYFWGDLCREHVRHIRLFRTRNIDTLAANPSMPYFEAEKPFVRGWFGATKRSFRDCTTAEALDTLQRSHGLCVLYQYMHRYADLAAKRPYPDFRESAERLMGTPGMMVATVSDIMSRLRTIHGVFVAQRGAQAWLANVGEQDATELQILLPPGCRARAADPGVTQSGELVRVPRLAAGKLLRLDLDPPAGFAGKRCVALDPAGRGRASFGFGEVLVNAGDEAWRLPTGLVVESGSAQAVFDREVEPLRPLSKASRAELLGLAAGQAGVILGEILFKGRSANTRKFLGADSIPLEDHANW